MTRSMDPRALVRSSLAIVATLTMAAAGCAGDDGQSPTESASGSSTETTDATTQTSETTVGPTGTGTMSTTASSGPPTSSSDGTTTDDPSTSGPTTGSSTSDPSDSSSSTTESVDPCPDDAPEVQLPRQRITKEELGVLVNTNDPISVALADYYVQQRGIPQENVVELAFSVQNVMPTNVFSGLKDQVDAALGDDVQALALTWTRPYRVGCMSATAAFALGFDNKYCAPMVCSETEWVDYFNSESTRPYDDHGLRPTMMLVASTEAYGKELIDRGIESDMTAPTGDGTMIRTTDVARSVRWPFFINTLNTWNHPGGLNLTYIDNSEGNGSNVLANTDNVLFYFTGLANVPQIDTNTYIPGAVADHLTSFGGQVPDSGQMSVARWIEAGATASFGTVVEPCNYTQKFPDTTVLLPHYFRGNTIVEAYWKSVAEPGEGNFVGEPLASPWGFSPISYQDCTLEIETTMLRPGTSYELQEADSPDGPWSPVVTDISVNNYVWETIEVSPVPSPHYRLVEP